jgi:predicted glycosyltransferase
MVGFGHIRRNASIAQALRCSTLRPAVVMIAEAWQAGALPMPSGVDCVTLPALRKDSDDCCTPRHLDVPNGDLINLRVSVIQSAIRSFDPDVLIADHLPLGAAGELAGILELVRRRGHTRCVLGLRDVLRDSETVRRTWSAPAIMSAMRDYYDAIWIYGDPAVYDPVREYGIFASVAAKVSYTGYLDERPRLHFTAGEGASVLANVPPGRLALCVVGGGQDGAELAEAFVRADLPPDAIGVVLTGTYMPAKRRDALRRIAEKRGRFQVLGFVPETAPLINRAYRVIAMGGYNTMCEVLSFEKRALIVPRVTNAEQWIRAQRMRELGLVEVLHPDELTPSALTAWLSRNGPPPRSRERVDLGGLARIPGLLAELLGVSTSPVPVGEAVGAAAS